MWTIRCTRYLGDTVHAGPGICVMGTSGVYSQRTLKHFHMLVGRGGVSAVGVIITSTVGRFRGGLSEMEECVRSTKRVVLLIVC